MLTFHNKKCRHYAVPSKSDVIYAKLRDAILSASLLPGTRFAEVELSRQFETGRFAAREALRRLHGEGLVSKEGTRYQVPLITPEEVHHVRNLRSILEAGAMRFLPSILAKSALSEVRKAAADYAALVKKSYFAGAREADLRFHRAIVMAVGNPRLLKAYDEANLPLLHITVGENPVALDDFEVAAKEHLAIYQALEKRDTNLAARLLEEHLRRGEEEVLGNGVKKERARKR
jgi:DNA-binding GntR family transcriptional regulator